MSEKIDRSKLIIPALGGIYDRLAPFSYAFMRFATGAVLVPHGVQKLLFNSTDTFAGNISSKGLPFATVLAVLVFISESVGAACLALGLFTRIAAAMIFIQMTVIILFFQWQYGYFWTNRGIEYALLWWLLCLAIFFRGGGRYSVDHYLGKEF